MAKAGLDGVKDLIANATPKYFHEICTAATAAMQKDVDNAIKVFMRGTSFDRPWE
jgi:hypothetical protein